MSFLNGSIKLFRLFGIEVRLQWFWWILVAYIWIQAQRSGSLPGDAGSSFLFNALLYLCLFAIVLIHEFGHALACKSVGGKAERIMLWPLGGVAFVQPPPRPGALLWSIVAGPLVNVLLLVPTWAAFFLYAPPTGSAIHIHDSFGYFLFMLAVINTGLLVFNILPIYPLDGGQILQALLWFITGRSLSLIIASVIGLAGGILLVGLSAIFGEWWLTLISIFISLQSLNGFRYGRTLYRIEHAPKHTHVRCPACGKNPPIVPLWTCSCGNRFDTFATGGTCPRCQRVFSQTACPNCQQLSPLSNWLAPEAYPNVYRPNIVPPSNG